MLDFLRSFFITLRAKYRAFLKRSDEAALQRGYQNWVEVFARYSELPKEKLAELMPEIVRRVRHGLRKESTHPRDVAYWVLCMYDFMYRGKPEVVQQFVDSALAPYNSEDLASLRENIRQLIGAFTSDPNLNWGLVEAFVQWYCESHPRSFPGDCTSDPETYRQIRDVLQDETRRPAIKLRFHPVRASFIANYEKTAPPPDPDTLPKIDRGHL